MKNLTCVATTLHPLTPAQVKLVTMFDHFDVQERLYEINDAMEWSFAIDYDLNNHGKQAQFTMWHLIKILVEINKERLIKDIPLN